MANHTYNFRNVDEALPELSEAVMTGGDEIGSRLGERTKELTQVALRLERPWERYITLGARRASLPAQIAETAWVLAGRNDLDWLEHYLPRAKDFSDDGKVWRGAYGPRLRSWLGVQQSTGTGDLIRTDQLTHVTSLMQQDRRTRRGVLAIYDPATDWQPGKDIPCNDFITLLNRLGELEMHVTVRSNDLIWGWSGINAFEWSTLQEVLAVLLGVAPGPLHFSIGSLHVYDRHWSRADALRRQRPGITWLESPRFALPEGSRTVAHLDELLGEWFSLEEDIRQGRPVWGPVQAFPEPMLRSWLQVLAFWWSQDDKWLLGLEGTAIGHAAVLAGKPQRKRPAASPAQQAPQLLPSPTPADMDDFQRFVTELHAEKHAAYGDSWKRRGEMLGILANIARKVDRLGVAGGGDTSADTAVDLLAYLLKYYLWLVEHGASSVSERAVLLEAVQSPGDLTTKVEPFNALLLDLDGGSPLLPEDEREAIRAIRAGFDDLERLALDKASLDSRARAVADLIPLTTMLARLLWKVEQGAYQPVLGDRNATRMWNPEAGLDEGFYEEETTDAL